MKFQELAESVCAGYEATNEEVLAVLNSSDDELLQVVQAAATIRHHFHGKRIKLNMLLNVKSGLCPEDCFYCSQGVESSAQIPKYKFMSTEQIVEAAEEAARRHACTLCIVASGTGPSAKELSTVTEAVVKLRENTNLKICACLGKLSSEDATCLQNAGVARYNHNVNTTQAHYPNICSTHTHDERIETIENVKQSGMSPCSGAIFGMGESIEERVEIAFDVKKLDIDSIPCNFLVAIDGTKMQGMDELTPYDCLRILAMMRFVNPSKEIRISGGREKHLRSLQPLGLMIA
ncbi:MAG: biotin synthase BioB, partial [Bacilli bacterium]